MRDEAHMAAFGRIFGAAMSVAGACADVAKQDAKGIELLFASKRMIMALAETGLQNIDARAAA